MSAIGLGAGERIAPHIVSKVVTGQITAVGATLILPRNPMRFGFIMPTSTGLLPLMSVQIPGEALATVFLSYTGNSPVGQLCFCQLGKLIWEQWYWQNLGAGAVTFSFIEQELPSDVWDAIFKGRL